MTNLKAITGTDEQIYSLFAELIENDLVEMTNGLHQFEIIIIDETLSTLIWMPKQKKQRKHKQVTVKQLNEKAGQYNLHVQRHKDGFEIINDRGVYKQVAFAKTIVGIQRKLTQEIDRIETKKIERACFNALSFDEQISRLESGQFSYN